MEIGTPNLETDKRPIDESTILLEEEVAEQDISAQSTIVGKSHHREVPQQGSYQEYVDKSLGRS